MPRKVLSEIPEELLRQDLERYKREALKLGAGDAKVITTANVLIDERVLAKCIYPKCPRYGTNANCPPHAMGLDLIRKVVNNFRYAVFFKLEVPTAEVVGDSADATTKANSTRKNHEIVSKIEAQAFYDGYYLALGFAGGSCKTIFCQDIDCSALIPGKGCRNPLRARSSMESVGMDALAMAARAGWDIYLIGGASSPKEIPHATKLGIVLIC